MSKPNNIPRVLAKDIYSYISQNTGLARDQISDCFESYAKLIEELCLSDYLSEDTVIWFPKLGNFYFKKREGRKKGTVYDMPMYPNTKGKDMIVKTVTLEEDEPDTYKLSFRVGYTLHKRMNKKRREKNNGCNG